MSFVICSNKAEEENKLYGTTANSINKAFSFRNDLSSTYKVPPNAQVALQSIQYSVNDSMILSTFAKTIYQYYGEDLEVDNALGNPSTIKFNSTAVPIKTPLVDTWNSNNLDLNANKEYNLSSFVKEFQKQLGKYMYHPNLRFKTTVTKQRDTGGLFTGFNINYDYYDSSDSNIPDDNFAQDLSNGFVRDEIWDTQWTYAGGVFTTGDPNDQDTPQSAILTEMPISLHNGELVVNFNNANASSKEWAVGLSRFVNDTENNGDVQPPYFSQSSSGDEQPSEFIGFYDYLVCRKGNTLKVYHTPCDSSVDARNIISREMIYGNDDIAEDYDLDGNASSFHKVKFTCIGQQIKIEMLESDDTAHLLYAYDATYDNVNQLKAVCQSNWSMYPILYIDDPETGESNTLTVETFTGVTTFQTANSVDNLSWDIDGTFVESSWFNSVEDSNNIQFAKELELRDWNDNAYENRTEALTYAGILSGTNEVIDLENVLITKPSDIYRPSNDANSALLLGFETNSPTSDFEYGTGSDPHTRRTFSSTSQAILIPSKSFFVKLDNFTQSSVNAFKRNKSTIIAHVPRPEKSDISGGKIYHEPNTLVYLDLNNSNEINLSSFDLSLCYVSERFAEHITGQTIICLYIRQKPS